MDDKTNSSNFDYKKAFCRNIGWVTDCEQQLLRRKRIAIAGMGGVGGVHLLTLARLGIGNFNIADMDEFDFPNFNRQVGANVNTVGQSKVKTLETMAKEINPKLDICTFPNGVTTANIDEFLKDVDLYVDGLDFFELKLRALIFKRCFELHIPAITAAPLGMGTAYLIFMPGQMTFEDYFRLEGLSAEDQQINFLAGLNPKALNRHYLVDESAVNLIEKRGPSTIMSCLLCAGVTGTEALKILLNRGEVYAAPYYHLFDAFYSKYYRGKAGNGKLLQKIKIMVIKQFIKNVMKKNVTSETTYSSDIEQILNLGRWAPSGDNSQPWRFEIVNSDQVIIHVKDDSASSLYDFNGYPTLVSCGFLLETLRLAASQFSRGCIWQYKKLSDGQHQFHIDFPIDSQIKVDPLSYCIKNRSVDRRSYRMNQLTDKQKSELTTVLKDDFEIQWFETLSTKWQMSVINGLATKIRLSAPELDAIHRKVMDVDHDQSTTGLPLSALGLSFISKSILKWSLKSEKRMRLLNQYLGGAQLAAFELDYVPGISCAAHFFILAKPELLKLSKEEIYLRTGQAMQRFWLKLVELGLAMHPSFAPLAFCYYAEQDIIFSQNKNLLSLSKKLQNRYKQLTKTDLTRIVFAGRVGKPKSKKTNSRSVRLPLEKLLVDSVQGL